MNEELKLSLIRVLPFLAVLFLLLFAIKKGKLKTHDLGLNKPYPSSRFLLCTFGFLLLVLGIEYLVYRLGILEIDPWHHSLFPSIIRITGAVVLAPVVEEFIFRGIVLNKLMQKLQNVHFSVSIQAVLFVLMHHFTYENTITSNIGVAQTFMDAMLFGYARQYTRSIYTPITMHMTGNLVATLERFVF